MLEGALQVRLFQRVGRKNQLTPAGASIYGVCRQMFDIAEGLEELIAQRVPSATRRVRIGVSDEVERSFVVEVVSLFLKQYGLGQRPKVTVASGTHEQLTERLKFRELDAVVTERSMIDPELENIRRAEVPVALTYSSRWKVRPTKHLKVAAMVSAIVGDVDAQWLMPSARFKLRGETDQFFEVNELKGHIAFDSDVIASIVRSVVDGIGLAFLPRLYVAREVREKSVCVVGPKEGYWKYRVWLACHAQNQKDALIQGLAHAFQDICVRALG